MTLSQSPLDCFLDVYCLTTYALWRHTVRGLAQLARAPALQAGGQRFESVILHTLREDIDILESERDFSKK